MKLRALGLPVLLITANGCSTEDVPVDPDADIACMATCGYGSICDQASLTCGCETEGWTSWPTNIDLAGGQYDALALDGSGGIHVAYQDADSRLRYAHKDGGGAWITEIIDATARVAWESSIAIDAEGFAHVAYFLHNDEAADLGYAVRTASGWSVSTIDAPSDARWSTSMEIDSTGAVHVAYLDLAAGMVRYARLPQQGEWQRSDVAAVPYPQSVNLVLDSVDRPHVIFDGELVLQHAAQDATGSWVVESMTGYAHDLSVSIDAADRIHIAYNSVRQPLGITYASRSVDGAWVVQPLDEGDAARGPAIALTPDGLPEMVWFTSNTVIVHAVRDDAGTWSRESVIAGDGWPRDLRFAIDPLGGRHLTFYEMSGDNLRYLYRCQ